MDKNLKYLNFYTKYSSKGTTTIDRLKRSSACFSDVFRGPKQLDNTYIIYVYNDSKMADAFTKIIVVFENLGNVAKDVIAQ